ncbi:ABC transporter permease [Nitrospira lenta]|uniref:ABC-type transport system, permease component n=1 Tax=Nitrospira lenta TaxID=1436998 RepID=A0A330L1S7_9BACT|nr:ABC transporter permease [Nitrospira lenta]SPP63718.1 ABC-type transport system, permease component [Nitrospira lenta]
MLLWGAYSLRNLWSRRVTTAFTVAGMGLVVFVLLAVLMLAHGLERTLGKTGDPANAIVLRKGALSEIDSNISRDHAKVIALQAGVEQTPEGRPMAVSEIGLQLTLRKAKERSLASLSLRGTSHDAFTVRPKVRLAQGRLWEPGTTEIMVGTQVARQFPEAGLRRVLHFGNREWTVVGVFDADGSGFDSEVWGDAEQFMTTFHRTGFSSMTVRLVRPDILSQVKEPLERDPRFNLSVKREPDYYEGKAESLAKMIRVTGLFLTAVFSLGAILGATMTMSAAVAQRTTEVGTLRTLGFTRLAILQTFLFESMALGAGAGVLGIAGAFFLQSVTISTVNWDTGSEIAFGFQLSAGMIGLALVFAVLMSMAGGVIPAARAARLEIVQALGERTV